MGQLELMFGVVGDPEGNKETLHRFRMLDYLDGLKNRIALVHYDDGFMSFTVPVEIGSMHFSPLSQTGLEIKSIRSTHSAIIFQHHISSISHDGDQIQAIYSETRWDQKPKKKNDKHLIMEGIPGIATIELQHWSIPNHKKIRLMKEDFTSENLVGRMVQLVLATPDDWIQKILTLPFEIQEYKTSGSTLFIRGSHGTEIRYKGLVGIRHKETDTIIDIRDDKGWMNRTIHVWHTTLSYL
jgi:hypothetical protein